MVQIKQFLFQIEPSASDAFTGARSWEKEAEQSWLCGSCGSPRDLSKAIEAIVVPERRKSDLDFVYGAGIMIASTKLLDALGTTAVNKWCHVGRVFEESGAQLDGYRTLIGRCRLLIRGEQCQYRVCDECGQLIYRAIGRKYVLPPKCVAPLYQSESTDLLISPELYRKKLARMKLNRVDVSELDVLQKPLDGLPARLVKLLP